MVCVRGECAPSEEGKDIEARLQALIQQHGLDDVDHPHHVRCTLTNCLAVCKEGPIMMVHPEGIRYKLVDEAALEQIFRQHFLQDQPVEALIYNEQPSRSIRQKRQEVRRRRRQRRRKIDGR